MSKTGHIICIAAGHGEGRYAPPTGFTPFTGRASAVITGDLWIGPRPRLETMRPGTFSSAAPSKFLDKMFGITSENEGLTTSGIRSMLTGLVPDLSMYLEEMRGMSSYPQYIQLIPYILFRNSGKYLFYARPVAGGEERLHGKISIGVGGHVDLADVVTDVATDAIDLDATLMRCARRESSEEIGLTVGDDAIRFMAVLYVDDQEVDALHLGIVAICDISDAQMDDIRVNAELGRHGFETLGGIAAACRADGTAMETWTRIVIEANPLA